MGSSGRKKLTALEIIALFILIFSAVKLVCDAAESFAARSSSECLHLYFAKAGVPITIIRPGAKSIPEPDVPTSEIIWYDGAYYHSTDLVRCEMLYCEKCGILKLDISGLTKHF